VFDESLLDSFPVFPESLHSFSTVTESLRERSEAFFRYFDSSEEKEGVAPRDAQFGLFLHNAISTMCKLTQASTTPPPQIHIHPVDLDGVEKDSKTACRLQAIQDRVQEHFCSSNCGSKRLGTQAGLEVSFEPFGKTCSRP
jgi:hypothetical protein